MAGRRRALIVANGEYENAGLRRLSSPAADADALADVLSDRAISDFDVRVLRNETAHVVQAEIEDLLAEGKPDDVLLLHFSCHGLKSDSGELFFAARNTRPDRLGSTAVPAGFVQRCMRDSRSRNVVLLLDCCYGGAFGEGVVVRASGDVNVFDSFPGADSGGRGRAVITASNSIEYAFEGDRLADEHVARTSVFTAALVEGLRTGAADRDEDGWIAIGELYEYLFDRVRERNPKQTPSRSIELRDDLFLARSNRRRIRPLPIPADLRAATVAENMFTRLGAVAELRGRLTSDSLPIALGAYEALGSMASTDIKSVADEARSARQDADVRPDVDVLRFEADTGALTVRLLGPPVATECTFEPSHQWIRIRKSPGGAEVTVTAAEQAKRQGKIVVSGPTGGAVITVEAEAAPEPIAWPVDPDTEPVPVQTGTEPAAVVTEPERAPEPAPEPKPEPKPAPAAAPAPSPGHGQAPARRADPAFLIVGLLAIAGGLLTLISLLFEYHYSLDAHTFTLARAWPGMEWYAGVIALLAVAGGVVAAVPWIRRRIGYGWLAGIGAAALWGLLVGYDSEKTFTAGDGHHLAAGFGFLFVGLLIVLVAGASSFWVLRRDPAQRIGLRMPRDVLSWLAIALGVAGAVAALKQYSVASDAGSPLFEGAWRPLVFVAVLAVAVPVVSTVVQPRFGFQMIGGWACGGFAVVLGLVKGKPDAGAASLMPLLLFAVSLVLLAVVAGVRARHGVAVKRRNQPIERRL